MGRRIAWPLVVAALLGAWIPWVGVGLSIAGFVASSGGRGPPWARGVSVFALCLGLAFTAAFHLLPTGSIERGDPELELLEERFQPVGNLEEKRSSP